jgi:Permease for cytosine/purines, uracil, thiamine, allantoin
MCYFIYWIIQFPLLLISPQKIRYLFAVKAVIVPIAMIAILIWAMVKAPPSVSLGPHKATIHGSTASWAWLSALNGALGFYATLSVNIPDFTVRPFSCLRHTFRFSLCQLALCKIRESVGGYQSYFPPVLTMMAVSTYNCWSFLWRSQSLALPVSFHYPFASQDVSAEE